MKLFVEIYGWVGMLMILLAYALNSLGVVTATSISYQLLNLVGALGVILVSWMKKAYQPATLNTVWLIIALIAVIGIIKHAL